MNPINSTIVTHHIAFFDFFLRIAIAMLCGFTIGFERQWINRAAGIQTNVLVCCGACIFILGSYFVSYEGQTASRIAAQIVSGVGFLGAGMIFRNGVNTHGINTAASIWCAAATGILCGMGLLPYALGLSALLAVGNILFRKFDHLISKHRKWTDLRVSYQYEVQVLAPRETGYTLRDSILGAINTNDHKIIGVKTSLEKKDYIRFSVNFKTYSLDYEQIQKVSEQIETLAPNLIVDWSQKSA